MNKKFVMIAFLSLSLLFEQNSFAGCYGSERIYTENTTGDLVSARVSQSCTCGSALLEFSNLKSSHSHGGEFSIDDGSSIFSSCVYEPSYVTITYSVNGKDIGWSKYYKELGGNQHPCNFAVSTDPHYAITCYVILNEKPNTVSNVKITKV